MTIHGMKLRDKVKQYVETRKALMKCRSERLRPLCDQCGYYRSCQVLIEYEEAWDQLKAFVESIK